MELTRELDFDDFLIEGPAIEPVDLDEFKRSQRITTTSEDTLIDTYLAAARTYVEELTGRHTIAVTRERSLEDVPYANTTVPYPVGVIELPYPPLLSVVSVSYEVDGSPDETTLVEGTDYVVHAPTGPYAKRGKVRPITGGSWPSVTVGLGTVRIRYRAGYGDQPGDVPELLKQAIALVAGEFYKVRANVHEGATLSSPPIGFEAIIRAFKYSALPSQPPMRTSWLG